MAAPLDPMGNATLDLQIVIFFLLALGLPFVKLEEFQTKNPCVHFNHRDSLGQRRGLRKRFDIKPHLDYWGNAKELWNKFYG